MLNLFIPLSRDFRPGGPRPHGVNFVLVSPPGFPGSPSLDPADDSRGRTCPSRIRSRVAGRVWRALRFGSGSPTAGNSSGRDSLTFAVLPGWRAYPSALPPAPQQTGAGKRTGGSGADAWIHSKRCRVTGQVAGPGQCVRGLSSGVPGAVRALGHCEGRRRLRRSRRRTGRHRRWADARLLLICWLRAGRQLCTRSSESDTRYPTGEVTAFKGVLRNT